MFKGANTVGVQGTALQLEAWVENPAQPSMDYVTWGKFLPLSPNL